MLTPIPSKYFCIPYTLGESERSVRWSYLQLHTKGKWLSKYVLARPEQMLRINCWKQISISNLWKLTKTYACWRGNFFWLWDSWSKYPIWSTFISGQTSVHPWIHPHGWSRHLSIALLLVKNKARSQKMFLPKAPDMRNDIYYMLQLTSKEKYVWILMNIKLPQRK
jgi:hypothetical protein